MRLQNFWSRRGCLLALPYDMEKGAGTFNPATFFGSLGEAPARLAYLEPCRRPADGRYGANPNRLGKYCQFQVLIKPPPADALGLYAASLKALGFSPQKHDLRFFEDDWQSPTLGASGLGWEARLDGLEITQITYFQQMASVSLKPATLEITYGLERLALYLQKKEDVYELDWDETISYGDLYREAERQFSRYNFEEADPAVLRRHFEDAETESLKLSRSGLYLPAYDGVIRASHAFNVAEARGAFSVAERARFIGRVRGMARAAAEAYLKSKSKPEEDLAKTVPA